MERTRSQLKGYDGGKKLASIKRHIGVDINGLPMCRWQSTSQPQTFLNVMADSGYTGNDFAEPVKAIIGGADVIIAKQSDLKQGIITPQRWIVERSFSWLGNYRRLWRNCERQLQTSATMLVLAFIRLLLKRP